MLPPNYSEPPNICTTCGKQWEGNPYEYETDNHEFPCPECAAQQSVQADEVPECDCNTAQGFHEDSCAVTIFYAALRR